MLNTSKAVGASVSPKLVRAAQAGSPIAFTTLYAMFAQMVDRTCLRILRDRDDAMDASQDVWLVVFSRINGLRNPEQFASWLHRIAVRTALQLIRAEKRRSSRVKFAALNAEAVAAEICLRVDVENAVAELPGRMRELVVLWLCGHTLADCAFNMGISGGTAKSQFHKARRRLRQHFSASWLNRPTEVMR
ncbi:MAG: RNA polymerase sigma factor [Gemmatimonadota bacterium]